MADLDTLLSEATADKANVDTTGKPLANPVVADNLKSLSTVTGDAGTTATSLPEVGTGSGFAAVKKFAEKVGTGMDSVSGILGKMHTLIATDIAPTLLSGGDAQESVKTLLGLCEDLSTALDDLPSTGKHLTASGEDGEKSAPGGDDKDSKDSKDKDKTDKDGKDTETSSEKSNSVSTNTPSTSPVNNAGNTATTLTSGTPMTTAIPMTTMTPMSTVGIPSTSSVPSTVLSGYNPLSGMFGGTTTPGQSLTGSPASTTGTSGNNSGVTLSELRQMVTDAKNKVLAEGGPSKTAATESPTKTSTSTTRSDSPLRATRDGAPTVRSASPDPSVAAVPLVQGQTVQGGAVDSSQISGRSTPTTLTSTTGSTGSTATTGGRSPMMGGMMPPMGGMMNGAGTPKSGGSQSDIKAELLSDDPLLTGQAARDIGVQGGVLGRDLTPDDNTSDSRKDTYLW